MSNSWLGIVVGVVVIRGRQRQWIDAIQHYHRLLLQRNEIELQRLHHTLHRYVYTNVCTHVDTDVYTHVYTPRHEIQLQRLQHTSVKQRTSPIEQL